MYKINYLFKQMVETYSLWLHKGYYLSSVNSFFVHKNIPQYNQISWKKAVQHKRFLLQFYMGPPVFWAHAKWWKTSRVLFKYNRSVYTWAHTFSPPSGNVYTTAQPSLTEPLCDHLSTELRGECSRTQRKSTFNSNLKSNGNSLKSSYTEFKKWGLAILLGFFTHWLRQ